MTDLDAALAPDALAALALRDPARLLDALRAHDDPLAAQLAHLVARHAEMLAAAPEQLALQLRARLPREDARARAWIDAAERLERAAGLVLRSRTLVGPAQPERWRAQPHSQLVHALVVLADGDTVVSAGEDGRLLRGSLARRAQQPAELEAHLGPVNDLALSADGRWMASAGDDHSVGLWPIEPGGAIGEPRHLRGHSHFVRQVAFAPGVLVSVSQDGTARTWALPDGRPLRTFEHGQDVMSLAVAPDGALLATSTINSALHLWDLRTGEKIAQLYGNDEQVMRVMPGIFLGGTNNTGVGHKDYPHALGFLRDGSLWSMGAEWIVWDVDDPRRRERIRQPPVTQFSAQAVCWLDDERVAIGDYGIVLLRVRRDGAWLPAGEQERLGTLAVGLEQCTALCLAPDGRTLLSGHHKGELFAWDLSVDPRTLPEARHGGPVWELRASPSGRYVVSKAGDNSACVWDAHDPDGRCVARASMRDPNSYGHWFAFARDERRVAFGEGKGWLTVLRVPEGDVAARVRIESEQNYQAVSAVLFDATGGALYAGLGAGGLYRVEARDGGRTERFKGFANSPSKLWLSADDRTLVSEDNFAPSENERDWRNNVYQLLGWDAATLERRWRVSAHKGGEREYVSFGEAVQVPEGIVSLDGARAPRLVLREPSTGATRRTFALPLSYYSGFTLLRDGRWFLLVQTEPNGPSRPTVFDPAADRVVHQHVDPTGWYTRAVAPDGRHAVRVCESALELYELRTGAVRARFFADHALSEARFSPDGARLFVGDRGGLVHVLELRELPAAVPAAARWPVGAAGAVGAADEAAAGEAAAGEAAADEAGEPQRVAAGAKKRGAKKGAKRAAAKKGAKRAAAKKGAKRATAKKGAVKKGAAKKGQPTTKRTVKQGAKTAAKRAPKRRR